MVENKPLDELLSEVFENVNNWLNFAEAKNAANIALVIASIAAIVSYNEINCFLYLVSLFFILSGIFSMLSFLPKLTGKSKIRKILDCITSCLKKDTTEENLLFFEDIKKYSKEEYVKKINEVYYNYSDKQITKYQLDLSNEIIYNSYIASLKYWLFKIAILLDIIAFLLSAIGIVINIFFK